MKTFKALLGGVSLGIVLSVYPLSAAMAATPVDQLIIGMSMANILSVDPAQSSSREADLARINIYDTLVEIDANDKSNLMPALATGWTISEDRTTITLTLRDDITFTTGNALDADDVVWSLRRPLLLESNAASFWRVYGFDRDNAEAMIRKVDDYTVEIQIPDPTDPLLLLYILANPVSGIIDSTTAMENETDGDLGTAWLNTNAAGSGAFTLGQWDANSILILERNEGYWKGAADMRRVVIRHMPESQTQRLMIERGDIDVAVSLSGPDLRGLEGAEGVDIQHTQEGGFYYISLSQGVEAFQDQRVREAIRYLIDYDGINETVMPNYGLYHQTPVQMDLPATLEDPGLALDVERAKELLAEAGYPDGFSTNIRVLSDSPFIEIATAFQADLAQAGITAEIISGGGSVVYDRMRDRDYEIAVGRGGGGQAPHPHSNLNSMAFNPDNSDEAQLFALQSWRAEYANEDINRLIDEALVEVDQARQIELYREVQQLYLDVVAPTIPISQVVTPVAVRTEVDNLIFHPSRTTRLFEVTKAR
jgi:peptide/nickel transport system substrate-binding protein